MVQLLTFDILGKLCYIIHRNIIQTVVTKLPRLPICFRKDDILGLH